MVRKRATKAQAAVQLDPDRPVNKIVIGDCIEGMHGLLGNSIPLIFADPPFNIGYEYDGSFDDCLPAGQYLEWSKQWMQHVHRMLTSTGTFWLAIGDMFVSELDMLAKSLGFYKRSHVIWYYTFGVNSPKKFTPSHTHLLYYTKHKTDFTFNVEPIKVPSARQLVYNDKRAKKGGRLPDATWILRPQDLGPDGFGADSDTWHIPRVAGTFKARQPGAANQMPEQLMARIVLACSNPGELVLDPFSGSGTTAAVAKKLGRQYLAYEQSERYATLSRDRVAWIQVGDALTGDAPQGSTTVKQ